MDLPPKGPPNGISGLITTPGNYYTHFSQFVAVVSQEMGLWLGTTNWGAGTAPRATLLAVCCPDQGKLVL